MLSSINLNLSEKLKNKGYRTRFFRGQAQDEVASLLKAARKKRHVTQPQLEKISGMKQSAISRIEQSSYARWNFQTLLKIAEALDLRVRFGIEYAEDVIAEYERMERDQENSRKPQTRRRHRRLSKVFHAPISGMSISGSGKQLMGDIGSGQLNLEFNQEVAGAAKILDSRAKPTGGGYTFMTEKLISATTGREGYHALYRTNP